MRQPERLSYEPVLPRKGYFAERSTSLFAETMAIVRFAGMTIVRIWKFFHPFRFR